MNRKKKIIVIALAVFLLLIGTLITLALWQPKVNVSSNNSFQVVDKLRELQLKGGTAELSEEDINDIIKIYFKGDKSYGSLYLKGIYAKLNKEDITLYIVGKYKFINFVASSTGTVSYKGGKLIYEPKAFKIGELYLPKALVYKYLGKYKNNRFSLENNDITFDEKQLHFVIDSFKITEGKVIISAPKPAAIKKKDNNTTAGKDNKGSTSAPPTEGAADTGASNSSTNPSQGEDANTEKSTEKLKLLVSQLDSAVKKLNSPEEKQILYIIRGTANKLIENPSYNYKNDEALVKDEYNKLPEDKKKDIKGVILSTVDIDNIYALKDMFP